MKTILFIFYLVPTLVFGQLKDCPDFKKYFAGIRNTIQYQNFEGNDITVSTLLDSSNSLQPSFNYHKIDSGYYIGILNKFFTEETESNEVIPNQNKQLVVYCEKEKRIVLFLNTMSINKSSDDLVDQSNLFMPNYVMAFVFDFNYCYMNKFMVYPKASNLKPKIEFLKQRNKKYFYQEFNSSCDLYYEDFSEASLDILIKNIACILQNILSYPLTSNWEKRNNPQLNFFIKQWKKS